jgi:hypothetical protein
LSDIDFMKKLIPWLQHVDHDGEKVSGLEEFPSRELWRTYAAEVRAAWKAGMSPMNFKANRMPDSWQAAVADAATQCDEPVQVPAT